LRTNSWVCNQLFTFSGDDESNCVWLNSSTVKISDSDLIPTSQINLNSGILRAACSAAASVCAINKAAPSQMVVVSSPTNVIVPVIVLSAPARVSSCDNVTIDGSGSYGSGGRAWKSIYWMVSDSSENDDVDAQISYFLNSFVKISSPISIPNHFFTYLTTYHLTLVLENFLGGVSTSYVEFFVSADAYLPQISIVGSPNQNVLRSKVLVVAGDASLSTCAPASSKLVFTWEMSLDNSIVNINSTSTNPRKFMLSANSLTVGNTYNVQLTVQTLVDGAVVASASTVSLIYVQKGAVVAFIKGKFALFQCLTIIIYFLSRW
jgi:hypothetical protein